MCKLRLVKLSLTMWDDDATSAFVDDLLKPHYYSLDEIIAR
jgi:hypothetical protein